MKARNSTLVADEDSAEEGVTAPTELALTRGMSIVRRSEVPPPGPPHLRFGESYRRAFRRHRRLVVLATAGGLLTGVGMAIAGELMRMHVTAPLSDRNSQRRSLLQQDIVGLQVQINGHPGAKPLDASGGATAKHLLALQDGLVAARTSRMQRELNDAGKSSTKKEADDAASSEHRGKLLAMSYKVALAGLPAGVQQSSEVSLLAGEMKSDRELLSRLPDETHATGQSAGAGEVRRADAGRDAILLAGCTVLLGFLPGLLLAHLAERRRFVFRSPGEVAEAFGLTELAVLPSTDKLREYEGSLSAANAAETGSGSWGFPSNRTVVSSTGWDETFSIAAEAYRNATPFFLKTAASGPCAYVIASAEAGAGNSTVTSNLGVALSQTRLRVVLIDANLRRPALHRAFSLENHFGLRNVLRGEVDLERIPTDVLATPTYMPNVAVVVAGNGKDSVEELLRSNSFEALLTRLKRDFEMILIDAPPALEADDAPILAQHADGAMLVVRGDSTGKDQILEALRRFEQSGNPLSGAILNFFDPTLEENRHFYTKYFRYQRELIREDRHSAAA